MAFSLRTPALAAAAILLTLTACGGSDDSEADPAGSATKSIPSAAATTEAPAAESMALDDYCAAAMRLNDLDVAGADADPAALKEFVAISEQLASSAPSEVRDDAKTYFGELIELVNQGIDPDYEALPVETQAAFSTVANYLMQKCD